MALTWKQIFLMCGMLVTGTINTISKKVQLDCVAPGYPNNSANGTAIPHKFNKPWFQSLIMFLGELACLFGFLIVRFRKRKEAYQSPYQRIGDLSESSGNLDDQSWEWIPVLSLIFAIPASADIIGTSLAGVGLLYIDASIWQMMRGCIIIFAGILSIIFLKRRLKCFNWTGMFVVVIGLALVGMSSVFKQNKESKSGGHAILGILLVLAGGFASSGQMVLEEVFLKKRGYHPLHIVGMEGLFGTVIMAFVILPAMFYIPGNDLNNSYENALDALYQISQNALLLVNCILYMMSIAFYNYFGLAVTQSLTAVHRTLIDALRTLFVWTVDLFIYYAIDKSFGEPFDAAFGLLQIDGFAFLVIGTLVYNKVMDLSFIPICNYPHTDETVLPVMDEDISVSTGPNSINSIINVEPPPNYGSQDNDRIG